MKRLQLVFASALMLLSGCGSDLPHCNSDEVKQTLLSLIKDEIMKSSTEDTKFRLTSNIDMLTTTNDSEKNRKSCDATITYSYPSDANEEFKSKINISYVILKNEANGSGFYLQTTGLNLKEPKAMQLSAKSLLNSSVRKNLGFVIEQDAIYSSVKEGLLKNGYSQEGETADCSKGCKFKSQNSMIEVFTQMNDGNSYRGSVQLPRGELVTNAYYSYLD